MGRKVAGHKASAVNVLVEEFPLPRAFHDLFGSVAEQRYPIILDSSLADARLGRWSFAAFDPAVFVTSRGRDITIESRRTQHLSQNPFRTLRGLLRRWSASAGSTPSGAPPFIGGAAGYFGYDLKQHLELLPDAVCHDIPLPEMAVGFYPSVLAYEHASGRCVLSVCDLVGRSVRGRRADADQWRERWEARCRPCDTRRASPPANGVHDTPPATGNFTRAEYLAAVRRAIDYIADGDIFQVNLSQRFAVPYAGRPFALYERLRAANPSPFGAYLAQPSGAVLSSSPERFLRVIGRHVETRPIKGTRPRTGDPATDERMLRELRDSAKDQAELTMIVDLERNDLGRVCEYGSVRVTERRVIEQYAKVFHGVATVEGDLHPRYDVVDLLKATFPGGSITGAPKIRAMQIIDELEPTARSVYTGAIGYLGFDGTCDLNIAIRTIIVAGGQAYAQVGGGIVADSVPEAEYDETLDKGRALFAALGCSTE